MIWVITSPERIHEEARILPELLDAGATRLLLRKPEWTADGHRQLLDGIDPAYYPRIIVRDHFWLYHHYGLGGVHWSNRARSLLSPWQRRAWVQQHPESSTGVHSILELLAQDDGFQTLLLSPVFDSISKTTYQGRFAGPLPNKDGRRVMALGGIGAHNIGLLKQWHYDGAALLGSIWRKPQQAVFNFQRVLSAWNRSDHM